MTERIFHIGIDLHGTLIDNSEHIAKGSLTKLKSLLKKKPSNFKIYICTGNDLPFVRRKIEDIFNLFDGAILETGCVISVDNKSERIIVPKDLIIKIKELEDLLMDEDHPVIYKFARRLSTISMFTKYGESILDFHAELKEDLKELDFCRVTRSSVAVDILPIGFDKYSGLKYMAEENDIIVAIADSLNDLEMLKQADITYMPGNADTTTIDILSETRNKKDLNSGLEKDSFYLAEKDETFGVIESLEHLFAHYKEFS
ncbi:MAG: HAD hydrolase family protein [Candidatus Delongbacteria bacterium]|jgi:hydroxymethylpyrimidine pyrophosphatase-like HAD family hydrolase|nr:HAD hydrolase family protein [Candidatus Delongbacteria bacterium]